MDDNYGIFSLKGKVIAVTGGTRRYGYHFCEALAEAGGTVILTSRDGKRAGEAASGFKDRGFNVKGYGMDQSDDNSIEEFVSSVISDYGRIDVLVNNARTVPRMHLSEITREELDKVFTVNSVGLILLTRRVVDEMKKYVKGNIINIGSIYGMGGQDPGIYEQPDKNLSMDYPIQKGGVIALTRQLATTLAQYNIRANCLSLGGLSETAPADPVFLERYCKRTPMGRMAVGSDVKGPIIFLASDASAYMTGVNMVVDGGWTAW
ncbi:MAG: SDR family oxidoreductase [Candidatus Omnitrophica bacterium]|nr:SDR family oxidoreductase [Candidatus Omnitrophota bacterium]